MDTVKEFLSDKKVYLTTFIILLVTDAIISSDAVVAFVLSITMVQILSFLLFFSLSMFLALLGREMISERYPETKGGIDYVAIIFAATMNVTFIVYAMHGKDYQPTIALMISSVLIGSGWWVQATVGKVTSRKSHTINTLMNQRNSSLFHDKNQMVRMHLGTQNTVNKALVDNVLGDYSCQDKEVRKELKDAVHGLVFIVNYYEFICSSLQCGAFDEDLIKECLEDIVVQLERRAFHVIMFARKSYGKSAFCSLLDVVSRWSSDGSIVLKVEAGESEASFKLINAIPDDAIFNHPDINQKPANADDSSNGAA